MLPGGDYDQHHYHIMEGPLVCGGDYAADSCYLLNDSFEWEEFVPSLQETRQYASSWNTTSGVYLLGDGTTTELVKQDGTTATSFSLKYSIE